MAATGYDVGNGIRLTETPTWTGSLGVHYGLGVGGLGLLVVLLRMVLVPIVMLAVITVAGAGAAYAGEERWLRSAPRWVA